MASSFLQNKAKKQAEKLEKKYGSTAYGGTTWLNNELSGKKKKKDEDEDDIAPVRPSKQEKDDGFDFFQKGAFEDGYQLGDISKAILGTAADVGIGVVKGASKLGEGIVDAAGYGIAGIADRLGHDDYADEMRKKAMKNSVDDFFAATDEALDKHSVLGRTSDSVMEGLGQVGGIILTGGVGAAGGLGVVGTTALTSGVMGVSSMGSGMGEAYMQGASDEEAATYGLIKGVVDAGSEMIFGGLGKTVKAVGLSKGISSLDDVFARKLASKITSQTAKNFVEYGVKASAEGVEEVLAGIGSAVGKKLTYMDEAELSSLVADENLLEQFVVGAVTSGIAQSGIVPGMSGGSLKESVQTGRDFITGMSQNEQKVIDREYENRINEQEQDGRKLSEKEKSKIYDAVVSDMEKGYISTDTIEEVLGGDTYKAHKDTLAKEKAMQEEYDSLYKMKHSDKSDEQIDRQAELKKHLEAINQNFNRNKLRESVMALVKDDRLAESYNERTRRGQAFEADLTRYDEKHKAVIQKAVESGILNNTNRTHEFVDMIAKISADKGVLFDFTNNERLKESGFAVDGKTVNGFVNENGVSLNIDSAKSLNSVVGHEITHVLEGTELYGVLQKTIVDYAKSKGDYQGRYDSISQLYKGVEGANIDAEITADLVGDYLFTDSDFIHNLSTNHRNVFQKVYDEIKYLCKVATAGSKEARELEKVKRAFEQAYKAGSNEQTGTKHSLSDSEGVELSKEQQEYFKDSKVRDENGNLKVMYHGTPNGEFTVFKDGTYFTDNKAYADRYQNPSASSISSGKVASNPKTFEVYLDIKKPFDITDAEARNIYINDYIKGGNALGINPYLSDAEYDKISTIDWTEGEDLRDFLIENDYDYDGLVLDEGGTGGYGDAVEHRGKSYVVFSPEQVKNTDNLNPTGDKDIRFSLSESVEETKDLMALHNLTEQKLLKSLELGGLPMPSLAVTKADIPHSNFGEITLIFAKDTIDPKKNKKNKIYSADAWTPVFPRVEYEADSKVGNRISQRLRDLEGRIDDSFQRDISRLQYGFEDYLNSQGGEEGLIQYAMDNYGLKAAYLEEHGKHIDKITKQVEAEKDFNPDAADKYKKIMDILGVGTAEEVGNVNLKDARDNHGAELEAAYPGITKTAFRMGRVFGAVKSYLEHKDSGPVYNTVTDIDATRKAVDDALDQSGYETWVRDLFAGIVKDSGIYNNKDLFTPAGNRRSFKQTHLPVTLENIVKAMAGQNNGNAKNVSGFNGVKTLRASTAETFKSVAEMHQKKGRLQNLTQEQFGEINDSLQNRLFEVIKTIDNETSKHGETNPYIRFDTIGNILTEIGEGGKYNVADIQNVFKQYSRDVNDDIALEVKQLLYDIAQMPVNIFEAKPERVVRFEEAAVFVIPNNADAKLKQELLNRGYSIAEYDPNVEGDRQRVVNGFEEYKFNLSDATANRKTFGTYNVYGKDIAMQTEQEIAPVAEAENSTATTETQPSAENSTEDIAPVSEQLSFDWRELAQTVPADDDFTADGSVGDRVLRGATAEVVRDFDSGMTAEQLTQKSQNALREAERLKGSKPKLTNAEQLMLTALYNQYTYYDNVAKDPEFVNELRYSLSADENSPDTLSDSDAPPEMGAPYYGDEESETTVDDPFENRYMDEVGSPKVKAYMYENPEVKPFFQKEAEIMLRELQESTKGEKLYNDQLYYDTNGEQGWTGQKRITSEQIAYLLDGGWGGKGYTYAEIEKGLKAIIEDNGKENNACSKRIEFLLNDRLKDGYTDFRDGTEIPPDEGYLALLNEKQVTEYNRDVSEVLAQQEELAPPVTEEDIAPVKPVAAEGIRPKREKQPSMIRVNEVGGTTSKNAKGQQTTNPEPNAAQPDGQQRMWSEKTAKILTEEPKGNKNQRGLWSMFKEYVLDNGMVFEDLSLKTGNRELQAKWHYIRNARAMAQSYMGKGKDGTRALNDVRQEVEKSGKMQAFSEYAYHLLNFDRMTLAQRYEGMENKPVFGNHVTAAQSAQTAARLERANPEFKKWAQELYAINTQLREMLVEGNVLSRETADLWAEMYPHYIPIRRAGYEGAAINVALDTNRTGVNAPIKKATGGNRDILPMFDTIGQRTLQTYRAIAKNRFGLELRKTLGTTIMEERASLDSVFDSMDNEEGLLKKGDKNNAPTFTVFENGKRYTFEITDEMYESMKPTSDLLAYTNPIASGASNAFRGVLTEYNPVFMLSNAIKDAQDILINSQHPARTYTTIPKAIGQMMSGGNYYREYMENGGEENTYFDGQDNTFDVKEKGAKKLLGIPPLSWISKANNIIERLPRMAEYIASRESGRSVEVSMLDAARVTTNFAAGGKLTKFANRNGATFLNASVQGAVQQARNIREAKANGLKGVVGLAAKVAVAGLPAMLVNHLLWDDDEEYEELSDYVKQNYYIVGKTQDGQFVRIPKGRTLAVIQDAFEQMKDLATGNDEADLRAFLELAISNLAPNNPVEDNIIAPIIQVKNNKTWYGEDLVPTRLADLPKEEQYDESTDSISKWLGEKLKVSPYKLNYLLNQYSGGVGDVALPYLTPEAERGKNSLFAPLVDKFTTDPVMNNQNVSDFYDTKDELTVNANSSKATDEDILKSKYFNSINSELSELYAKKREIQNSDKTDAEKYAEVYKVQRQIVELTKEALNDYPNVTISGNYASVGNRRYRLDDGTWTKISDKQLERQNAVTEELGITPEEYWSKTDISFLPMPDGEYEYAYDNPANYALAKSVGGYDAYRAYSKDLSAIKADKDKNGKTINGSRKEKVLEYINNLDADFYTKIILWKNEYNSDDTYNNEIIEYLNNNDDISEEEMREVLLKLGFEVDANGNISW